MVEKTLKQHLADALAKRWASKSEAERKEHSAKMNAAKAKKRNGSAVGGETPKT